jgi:DNA-binding response OmpR family regulator
MKKYRILYAEDDETLAFLTKDNLESSYDVTHCSNGELALDAFQNAEFDICILDIMIPKLDGFDLAKAIRTKNSDIPILFLSAKTLKEDRIKGLKIGADDYLVKPFSIEELLLKIEIFLKRSQKNSINTNSYTIGSFQFDAANYLLLKAEKRISLTQREAQLLQFFLENKNIILKRETILKSLWGNDDYFSGRSLDVFISRLRKILVSEPRVTIENQHGVGFRFLLD